MAKDVNKFKYKVSVVLYIHKCVETIEEMPKRTYMLIGGAETTLNINL